MGSETDGEWVVRTVDPERIRKMRDLVRALK